MWEALAPGEHLYSVGPAPATSPLLQVEDHGPLAQMVWTAPLEAPSVAKVIPLTGYFGVYYGPRLAAMAGERMHTGSCPATPSGHE